MIITRDQAFSVVCSIRTPFIKSESVGTGVFMTKDGNDAWIITAAHVAKETNSSTYIAIGDESNQCHVVKIIELNKNLAWKYHPVADIAVLKIDINQDNQMHIAGRCLPLDHFNLTQTSVSRDCELTSIGFPNGLGIHGKFSPLTFRSYASSSFLTFNRADTGTLSDFFCLENPSVGGYSGCPVFDLGYMVVGLMTSSKEKTICHGIMHGTMSDDTGGKIAVVTPSYYLNDLVL